MKFRHIFHNTRGGAALEYVIVSTFAAIVSLAAIAYVAKLTKDKLADLNERLPTSAGELDVSAFDQFDLN